MPGSGSETSKAARRWRLTCGCAFSETPSSPAPATRCLGVFEDRLNGAGQLLMHLDIIEHRAPAKRPEMPHERS